MASQGVRRLHFRAAPHLLGKPPHRAKGTACSEETWWQSRLSARLCLLQVLGPGGLCLILCPLNIVCVCMWLVQSGLKLVSDVAKFLSGQVETNWFTSVIVSDKSAVASERSQVAKRTCS